MKVPPPWLIQRLHEEAQANRDRETWDRSAHVEVGLPVHQVPEDEPCRSDNDSGFEIVDFTI
jgi:hypothetical protein